MLQNVQFLLDRTVVIFEQTQTRPQQEVSARYFSRDRARSVGQYGLTANQSPGWRRWHEASVETLDKAVVREVIHF